VSYYRKLPSGLHTYAVRYPDGHRRSFTDPIKRVAKQRADDAEADLRRGDTVSVDPRFTLGRWYEEWVGTRRVEPATAKKNASHWRNHVAPRWAGEPLVAIRRSQVQRWVVDMGKAGVGADTVHACYNLLAGMLTDAVLEGRLGASPCREIDLPRIVKRPPRWLTPDEYGRIQLALAETPRAPVWRALVGLGAFSGLRVLGELAGLDVEHIDFARQRVWVSQVVTRTGLRPYPKNDASARSVPFPDEVADLLWPIVGDRGSGPVFTSPTGSRVNESNFRNRVWRPALERAGVAYESPYILRHTAASWLVQAGVPDYEVAAFLGHASTRMLSTYGHLNPDRHDRVRAAWGGATRDTSSIHA
jgi:integrase